MNSPLNDFPVQARAVRFGRGVLAFIGICIFAVATLFSVYNPQEKVIFVAACMFGGLFILILAFALRPEAVAKLGFWAPLSLPSDAED